MAYQTDIKNSVKVLLELGTEFDTLLDEYIILETAKQLKLTNRTIAEIDTKPELLQLIKYAVVLAFNKRFQEGMSSSGVSGFSQNFEVANEYKDLLRACKRLKVL